MDKVLLSIVLASGLCAVSSHAARTYHVVNEQKTWTEAQSYCREHYTDLATIDNMEDVDILKSLINPTITPSAWIGLHRTDMYGRWSLTNSSFYKHGEMEFRNWSTGEPNGIGSGPSCGAMGEDGLWNDAPCEVPLKAVCYYVGGSNVEYYILTRSMSWTEAQSYCRENYTDLVSVRNNAENEKVKELVPPGTHVWIGLFRDSWKWSDGSNSSFRFWRAGRPYNNAGRDCVYASYLDSRKWGDYYCNDVLPFICYSLTEELATTTAAVTTEQVTKLAPEAAVMTEQVTKLAPEAAVMTRQVFKLHLRVEDGENLDDEAMKEALLEQVKQKLKEQGLGHVKVSFRKQADGKFFTKENDEL